VASAGFTLKEGQYMDVDDDGIIWLVVNANEGKDGIMKIAPDGSACAEVVELGGVYSVEHEGGFLLCGMKDGSAVVVLDDSSYEKVATIPLTAEYGDRVVRMLVINDVLFVADAGNDNNNFNAVHAAPLTADGQVFFDELVNNIATYNEKETDEPTEAPTDAPVDATEAPTDAPVDVTDAPTDATTSAPEEATKAPQATDPVEESGCASVLMAGTALTALMMAAAAAFIRKKD